jgi:hypothetical protein
LFRQLLILQVVNYFKGVHRKIARNMPSSMEDFISKGLFLMSLKDQNSSSKSTVITALGLRAKEKTSSNFDFHSVFKFVNSEAKYKEIFKEDGGIEKCLQKFLFSGEELTIENYKSVMKFAPMIEFWDEYRVAQTNTKPNDTFFANIIIDVSIHKSLHTTKYM